MNSKLLRASTILITTTIGAGIYGIPYAVNQFGLFLGLFVLAITAAFIYFLHLMYSQIIIKTEGEHQLPGYTAKYFGQTGRYLAFFSIIFGIYGALLAYIVKIGEFFTLISGLPYTTLFSLVFFLVASLIVFWGYKAVSSLEYFITGLIIFLVLLINFIGLPYMNYEVNQLLKPDYANFFEVIGVFLFAFTASVAIPEMEKTLRGKPELLVKAIKLGLGIIFTIYLLFAITIVGITGENTSTDAISGLQNYLPIWIVKLFASLGIVTMGTAFVSLSYILRKVWQWDFKVQRTPAFFLSVTPPFVLFILGQTNFLHILGVTGNVTGILNGVIIIALYLKIKNL